MDKVYINELAATTIYTVDQINHLQRRFNLSEKETKVVCNIAMRSEIPFEHLEGLLLRVAEGYFNEL